MNASLPRFLTVGRTPLSWAEIVDIAYGRAQPVLDPDPTYRESLDAGAALVRQRIDAGDAIYGVTTGFGDSWNTSVDPSLVHALQTNLVRYHGCGVGPWLDEPASAAIVASRLVSLARGWSGVRPELLEAMCVLLRHRILPRIPSRGSVGASGDLTPLSYVAATLVGEREVTVGGKVRGATDALAEVGLDPVQLAPKEALALMNGTSAMTGLGCLMLDRARRLARWGAAISAAFIDVTRGNPAHMHPRIHELKPHPGQGRAAAWIREDLDFDRCSNVGGVRLQDRYALRCAPHVIGVLADAAEFAERVLDVELESVDDNPIVDVEAAMLHCGGNFFGGHIAMVMDTLKTAVANLAGLMDRQIVLACVPQTSGELPANLVAPGTATSHHGFKGMQITASALAAEALKLSMPASVFSRSTESHNQDVVSMGMHSVLDCRQILELAETVAAIATLVACQAVDLRGSEACGPRARQLHRSLRDWIEMVTVDRAMDGDIECVLAHYRAGDLPTGAYS
jgi:histidine ammonia-lyase